MIKRLRLFSQSVLVLSTLFTILISTVLPAAAQLPVDNNSFDQQQSTQEHSFNDLCSPDQVGAQADCGDGLICADSDDVPRCFECDRDTICRPEYGPNAKCSRGVCVRAGGNIEGKRCINNAQCVSGNCNNGQCAKKKTGSTGGNSGGNAGGASTNVPDYSGGIDLTIDDIYNIILAIACRIQQIGFLLAVIAVVWIGYQYIYYAQNPTKLAELRKAFGYVVVGIIVIAAVYTIIATVAENLGATVDFSFLSCTSTDVGVDFGDDGGGDVVP